MTDQTFPCPRCEHLLDRGRNRMFDNLYQCPKCLAYIQDGQGYHGIAERDIVPVPEGMTLIPHHIQTKNTLLKFFVRLVGQIEPDKLEAILSRVLAERETVQYGNPAFVTYVIDFLRRMGVTVL